MNLLIIASNFLGSLGSHNRQGIVKSTSKFNSPIEGKIIVDRS